ncbi:hypothetical protein L873DRAFT_204400 [Choiromyces venosus 120613-1]|uniref:Uncharacterized protein n=1 Tax=Choiromyces venosus 120613-1 TaxID=1336337 RepID=A0A3N4J2B5_9PEZI|nr:hypothetical protein L873DRAFT_204400 [Choiromyces venosus 120613-1]
MLDLSGSLRGLGVRLNLLFDVNIRFINNKEMRVPKLAPGEGSSSPFLTEVKNGNDIQITWAAMFCIPFGMPYFLHCVSFPAAYQGGSAFPSVLPPTVLPTLRIANVIPVPQPERSHPDTTDVNTVSWVKIDFTRVRPRWPGGEFS